MGSYRISVRRNASDDDFSVIVHDETERTLGELAAFSTAHVELVARDLVTLVRRKDPDCDFTLDLRDSHAAL